jgi:hypothetical protein
VRTSSLKEIDLSHNLIDALDLEEFSKKIDSFHEYGFKDISFNFSHNPISEKIVKSLNNNPFHLKIAKNIIF